MAHKYTSKYVSIPVNAQLSIGALANQVVILGGILGALAENFFAINAKLSWSWRAHTAGEGPVQVGLSHGDLTAAEVEAYLELSWTDPNDKIAAEVATRGKYIVPVGVFDGLTTEEKLFDGRVKKSRIKWVTKAEDLSMYAHCQDVNGLTTGTTLEVTGKIFGYWML